MTLTNDRQPRQYLDLKWSDYRWPLYFMLSMSLMGLMFPLGYIFVFVIIANSFRRDRYDFIIMMTLFFGGYGLIGEGVLPVKTDDLALVVAVCMLFFYRKTAIVRKTVLLLLAYFAVLMVIASYSSEPMWVQMLIWRRYVGFIYFIVPMAAFAGEKFEMKVFFRKLFPYAFIFCVYYIIDGFILKGFIFLPFTPFNGGIAESTFYSPVLYMFERSSVRKYPQGLVFLILCVYPLAKYYKLRLFEWVLLLGAFAACRTFTVMSGFIVGYVLCLVTFKNLMKVFASAVVGFVALYFIDSLLPVTQNEYLDQSMLRIKSSIDQVVSLSEMADDVDFSTFGSGRVAQILPKVELVDHLGKQWTGLGFLHPDLTTDPALIVDNEYYTNIEKSQEVAANIECEPFQIYINVGFAGLIAYAITYVSLGLFVRRFRYGRYFTILLFMTFWLALGAYGGLIQLYGVFLAALCYATVLMSERTEDEAEAEHCRMQSDGDRLIGA